MKFKNTVKVAKIHLYYWNNKKPSLRWILHQEGSSKFLYQYFKPFLLIYVNQHETHYHTTRLSKYRHLFVLINAIKEVPNCVDSKNSFLMYNKSTGLNLLTSILVFYSFTYIFVKYVNVWNDQMPVLIISSYHWNESKYYKYVYLPIGVSYFNN